MKVGDKFPVRLLDYEVAEATIVEIDVESDEVYLEFPATRVVMGRTSGLGDLQRTPEKDRLFGGVEQDGDVTSEAQDDVRALYEAEGIELDDEPDEQSSGRVIGRQGPSRGASGPAEPGKSLSEMDLDGID